NFPPRTTQIPDDIRRAAGQYLVDNSDALRLLRQAASATQCRYPIDLRLGYRTLLPHLSTTREAARLLAIDGIMAMESGDRVRAAEDVHAAARLARSLEMEPTLISQLVRIACLGINVSALEQIATRGPMDDRRLAGLGVALAEAEQANAFKRGMVGELCNGE